MSETILRVESLAKSFGLLSRARLWVHFGMHLEVLYALNEFWVAKLVVTVVNIVTVYG